MPRVTTAVLLGAAVLVTTWVSAPAAPTAPPVYVSPADLAVIEQMAPLAADVDQEVAQLRTRMATVPRAPEPVRDPFSFGSPRPVRSTERSEPEPDRVPDVPLVVEPTILWPTLAAVINESSGPTAVIGWGDSIEFLKAGDHFLDFVVVRVSSVAVDLRHVASAETRTLSLR